MTLEEYKKEKQIYTDRIQKRLEDYKIGKGKPEGDRFLFFNRRNIRSNNLMYLSIDETIAELQKFSKIADTMRNSTGVYDIEIDTNYEMDQDCLDHFRHEISYLNPVEKINQVTLDKFFRVEIEKELYKDYNIQLGPRSITPELMTLFEEGSIDWDTLGRIVYGS